jgi:hypothetical protein
LPISDGGVIKRQRLRIWNLKNHQSEQQYLIKKIGQEMKMNAYREKIQVGENIIAFI